MVAAASHRASGMANARRLTKGPCSAAFLFGGWDEVVKESPGIGIFFIANRGGKEIVCTEYYPKTRFVLIENVVRQE
jgi:hypothetical protein